MLIILLCALLLDYFFGEPRRYHPLVAFGRFAHYLEQRLNEDRVDKHSVFHWGKNVQSWQQNRLNGLIALLVCILPAAWLVHLLVAEEGFFTYLIEIISIYLAVGLNSLKSHARQVFSAIQNHNKDKARSTLALMVSRDTQTMDEQAICRAATESVLENGSDAVFAAIFWFVIAGAPGVIIYRLSNTLDAMWGYKNARYQHFGFFIAKFDDLLNFIPARLTALSYALMGHWQNALNCWSKQGPLWDSPNAGVVMAAGAGALNVKLGGEDSYHGEIKYRADLGCGADAQADTIEQACLLVDRATMTWLVVIALFSIPLWF